VDIILIVLMRTVLIFRKVVRGGESSEEEGEGSWEKMQIRKGITGQQVGACVIIPLILLHPGASKD
jgi:hypothetical protein